MKPRFSRLPNSILRPALGPVKFAQKRELRLKQNTLDRVIEQIGKISAKSRSRSINADTEIYKEMGIYGDDFVFDIVFWAEKEFGVMTDVKMSDYVPSETNFPWMGRLFRRLLRIPEPQFKSLTVRDVVAAIERRSWQSSEQDS